MKATITFDVELDDLPAFCPEDGTGRDGSLQNLSEFFRNRILCACLDQKVQDAFDEPEIRERLGDQADAYIQAIQFHTEQDIALARRCMDSMEIKLY